MLRKPALRGDCIEFFNAFSLLGASRNWNEVGPQPIALSEIKSLFDPLAVDEQDQMKFIRIIKQLDRVEMKHLQAESKKKR